MEDLRENVYECTLAVEAHMICDLLACAGISARVDADGDGVFERRVEYDRYGEPKAQ